MDQTAPHAGTKSLCQATLNIPVVLLKTRSQPHDAYEDYFSSAQSECQSLLPLARFDVAFTPVLEHKHDEAALTRLGDQLSSGELKNRYGGMIFTSQRAVEGWAEVVYKIDEHPTHKVNADADADTADSAGNAAVRQASLRTTATSSNNLAIDARTNLAFETDIQAATPFPLYTVGPATARALTALVSRSQTHKTASSFLQLNPEILGAHTGNGAELARYIIQHYNHLHSQKWFTFHDAPRLPFIPLIGMGSENYSRKRLEAEDPRLVKQPLLFLVGEQRRDIIPRTLTDERRGDHRVGVEEVEVYSTVVKPSFQTAFNELIAQYEKAPHPVSKLVVIVVFSPQGSKEMLQSIGYLDENEAVTDKGRERWSSSSNGSRASSSTDNNEMVVQQTRYVIVTIGPTTRDYLHDRLGVQPDVCAEKPSPEGVGEGILRFLKDHNAVG